MSIQTSLIWLLRLGFHLLYNQFAWTYDTVAWLVSLGQWKDWGRTAIPFLQGPRVLDVAHGPGNLLLDLAMAGFSPIGYDLSPFMSRIAQNKLDQRGLSIPLGRGRAQQLPFPAKTFNSVVSTFPAEFILQADTLSEIHRVLATDGVFVMLPVAFLNGRGILPKLADWLLTITGQRPAGTIDLPPQLAATGFHSRIEWIALPQSRVMLIVSHKSPRNT